MEKKVDYEDLVRGLGFSDYRDEAEHVMRLIAEGSVRPVRASGTNGKKPAMYRRYWVTVPEKDHTGLLSEINSISSPRISTDYYRTHPEIYDRERKYVRQLDEWLERTRDTAVTPVSLNERSFEIWGLEKFLSGRPDEGVTSSNVLRHCGVDAAELVIYRTAEPLSYYTRSRNTPQSILILENLDPFYGLRKYMTDGGDSVFGVEFGTLVYGAGKRVVSIFRDFDIAAEPHMAAEGNRFLYAGDLDFEGIGIFENLAGSVSERMEIIPFTACYKRMLSKAAGYEELPLTSEKQNRNISGAFFSFFDDETVSQMTAILDAGRYIPQEILNITDYKDHAV